jgi:hypothetical protein
MANQMIEAAGFGSIGLDRSWTAGKKDQELAIMSRKLNGHLAVVSLGLLAATAPFDRAAATQDGPPTVSPAARWLQLAIDQTPKTTPAPKVKKLDVPKRNPPRQPTAGAPAVPSEKTNPPKKTDLTPPDPNKKPVDQTTNVKLVAVTDQKFGPLRVTPAAKATYLALPSAARAQLSDPKGGAQVSEAALQQMAAHYRGFKPPKALLPKGTPCGPPGTAGSVFVADGNGNCTFGSPGIW